MTTPARSTATQCRGTEAVPRPGKKRCACFEKYTQDQLYGEVWNRPALDKRDRSLITIAAMIARGQATGLIYYADQAIENGVKPMEISETITHLAYYTGWGNAMAAVGPVKEVFEKRKIGADQLPSETPTPLPLDEAAEAKRAEAVAGNFGSVAPGLVEYTTDYLFKDLWLRPDLAPRDRSLITVAALIANNQVGQIPFHLNRAMDNGLTQEQAAEVITHLAFYQAGRMRCPRCRLRRRCLRSVRQKDDRRGHSCSPSRGHVRHRARWNNFCGRGLRAGSDETAQALASSRPHCGVGDRSGPGGCLQGCAYGRSRGIRAIGAGRAGAQRGFDQRQSGAYPAAGNLRQPERLQSHLKSPHFVRYKVSTEKMVKSLRLDKHGSGQALREGRVRARRRCELPMNSLIRITPADPVAQYTRTIPRQ